jgi:hypothetical protein
VESNHDPRCSIIHIIPYHLLCNQVADQSSIEVSTHDTVQAVC